MSTDQTTSELSIIVSLFSLVIIAIQALILWRQTKILGIQTSLSETVDLSVELIRSTATKQTLCVNVKNEGKGIAHHPVFRFCIVQNKAAVGFVVLGIGNRDLQSIGPGSTQNFVFSAPDIPLDSVVQLSWNGIASDGRAFSGSHVIPLSSARVIDYNLA